MWKNPHYWKFRVSSICGSLSREKKKKKGRLKITWKQNTERRKSKWGWNNNHDLTWIFFVTTNDNCHLRRKCVLVGEPVHISILKTINIFHLHKSFSCSIDLSWWPVIEDTILECSIPKSQPVEDSVFKNIRRMAIDCWLADDTIISDIALRPTFLKMVKLSRESTGHR